MKVSLYITVAVDLGCHSKLYLLAGLRSVPSTVVDDRLTVRPTWTTSTNETRNSTRRHRGFTISIQQRLNKTWNEELQFRLLLYLAHSHDTLPDNLY